MGKEKMTIVHRPGKLQIPSRRVILTKIFVNFFNILITAGCFWIIFCSWGKSGSKNRLAFSKFYKS